MVSFPENRFKRFSIISFASSLSSKDSVDSPQSIELNRSISETDSFAHQIEQNYTESSLNEQTKEKIYCSGQFLFFGPLILCLILLISGIIVFIIVGQRSNKDKYKETILDNPFNSTPDDDFIPILCPFNKPERSIQSEFALNELKCGLHRSSIIHIYYLNNNINPINPGENLTIEDIINPPVIQLNFEYLSKFNSKSFVLIFLDPIFLPNFAHEIILHWIRYISSSFDDEHDICHYKFVEHIHRNTQQKIVLLYATNSSKMIIRAKTICNRMTEWFQLTDYVTFIKLKLIGATHFFIPYIEKYQQ